MKDNNKQMIRVVDGVTYCIDQDMVNNRHVVLRWLRTIGFFVVVLPFVLVVGPIAYVLMGNKKISQITASLVLPIVMKDIDASLSRIKRELLKNAKGDILDVGCGAGGWLEYFEKASSVTELEPNPFLLPKIERSIAAFKAQHPNVKVHLANKFVHELDENFKFDYVVFGNVMCEVPNQKLFLEDVNLVLKPGGKIVFVEHVKRSGDLIGIIQDWVNPFWCRVSDGCNCNRDTVRELKERADWNVEVWQVNLDLPFILSRFAAGIIRKN
jgi:SAM-dependent methyltransferase